jgi:hypothetical protein
MEAEILNELKILTDLGFPMESMYVVEEGGLVFLKEDIVEMTGALERGERTEPLPKFIEARAWHNAWRARNPD